MDVQPDAHLHALLDDVVERKVDRNEFLRRAAALGISASAAGALLSTLGAAKASGASLPKAGSRVLTIAPYTASSNTFEPANTGAYTHGYEMDGLFEGLITYKPGVRRWETVNALAETIDVSRDGKRMRFTLKKGVPFHKNFGEVTAEDVKYSYERVAGIQKLYPDAAPKTVAAYASEWASLERVRVTGKYSGEIVLKHPDATILTVVLPYYSAGLVVSKRAIQKFGKGGATTHPIGTGPYELATSFTPNRPFSYKRFRGWGHHWNRPADWDEIRFEVAPVAPGQPSTIPLEGGQSDFDPTATAQDYLRLRTSGNVHGYIVPTLSVTYLGINVQHPKLTDVRVRQAIRSAIDVPAILNLVHEGPAGRAYTTLSPSFGSSFWKAAPHYARDVTRARALLSAAGVTNLQLDLADQVYPATPGLTELVQANLADVGIKITIIPSASVPSNWWSDPKVTQLTVTTVGGAPDPTSQVYYYKCDQVGVYNTAQWCDRTYSALYDRLVRTPDARKRVPLAIEMQQLMDKSVGFVWLYYPNYYFLSSRKATAAFDLAGNYYPTQFRLGRR